MTYYPMILGMTISCHKDPYESTRTMESKSFFFRGSPIFLDLFLLVIFFMDSTMVNDN